MITARATAKAHDVPVASDTVWENRSNQQESPFRFVFIVSILVLGKCIPAMAAESIPQPASFTRHRSEAQRMAVMPGEDARQGGQSPAAVGGFVNDAGWGQRGRAWDPDLEERE